MKPGEEAFLLTVDPRAEVMDANSPTDMKKPGTLRCSIKLFVLCHGLLQFSQLLYSAYFKSTISTIERRYGLSSYSSGTISSLNEVSNSVLIVFVSYFGNRVHRPRVIGIGGLLMAISAMMLTLPHFLSQPYDYTSVLHNRHDICNLQSNSSNTESCDHDETKRLSETNNLWLLMASAQLLFGIGSVPIQPYGISYIDDFAGPANSPLYIAILFAVSVFGPAIGYLLGSVMLQIYVDVNRNDLGAELELRPSDPRWIGAWWMGLLISTGCLVLTSIPYFFFPRSMSSQGNVNQSESDSEDDDSLLGFLKSFPKKFVDLLLSPLFLILVLAQCCFSSVIAGLSTFLNKYLERQYAASAAYGSLLVGAVNLPAVAVGMLIGGIIMKRVGLSLKAIPRFCVVLLTISTLLCIPLFCMGCSTQKVSEVNHQQGSVLTCSSNCSCPPSAFNPVCGSDDIEYISPCHAGCTNFTKDPNNTHRVQLYTNCRCIPGSQSHAHPAPCKNSCAHFLLPVILVLSLASLIACLTHNPMYMMVLRSVPSDEKSFAIGIQFLLMRLLAWLPAPALYGMAIDTSCIRWRLVCEKKSSCGYYDNNSLRNRYLGLQVGYKVMGIVLLMILGWKVHRTEEYSLADGKKNHSDCPAEKQGDPNLLKLCCGVKR
ncbi:solute carrier organic anion transporter family member 2A1 isoform X2 [Archocentrus centrarchus]|uniref:solute carrier organic anion transporter family member 2A1 isoform X2 n=1 Tax=Archocentrus centrarchus TaxID=63155 RepID=UPI0011EA4156|nr:solute carrier organic anion transporter family member 2A1 isoform X2 [Archocentrus centrarchus]